MSILPISKVIVETAEFDTQRLKAMLEGNPLPVGTDYQLGEQYDSYNLRQYILHRDGYRCRCCGKQPNDKNGLKLHIHHLESRKTGGDSPGNLVTLCSKCHEDYHAGLIAQKLKRKPSMRDAAFMGVMRKTLMQRINDALTIPVTSTYGYTTKLTRESHGIKKTHTSDALCIAKHPTAKTADTEYMIRPVRKHNRQIHKCKISKGGYRKNNQCLKYVFGYKQYDMVGANNEVGFIFGRRSSGHFDIRHLNGEKISASISHKKIKLLQRSSSVLTERRSAPPHA